MISNVWINGDKYEVEFDYEKPEPENDVEGGYTLYEINKRPISIFKEEFISTITTELERSRLIWRIGED